MIIEERINEYNFVYDTITKTLKIGYDEHFCAFTSNHLDKIINFLMFVQEV